MKFGFRIPSLNKRIAARTSVKHFILIDRLRGKVLLRRICEWQNAEMGIEINRQ